MSLVDAGTPSVTAELLALTLPQVQSTVGAQ
jgi:hypothetical protein